GAVCLGTAATFTPLRPPTYCAMPRYSDSAIFWRYSGVFKRRSSPGLLMKEISARMDGILAPMSTMNGAFLTPRSRTELPRADRPEFSDFSTSPANALDLAMFHFNAIL